MAKEVSLVSGLAHQWKKKSFLKVSVVMLTIKFGAVW